jgi:arylsulfatase A-like enzyme
VPFLLRWTGQVEPGETDALVSHVDFLASFAGMAGVDLPENAGPDSLDMLDALLGRDPVGRSELVCEGIKAKTVLRQGDWILIPPHEGPAVSWSTNIETGNSPDNQLYDLSEDIGQISNRAEDEPERVTVMTARLEEIRAGARTRP